MSLQVWLPLNGDLHNQGLSDVIVTNNGAIVDNNGKIGKCYNFGQNKYLKIDNYANTFLNFKEFSLSVWFKCTAQNSSHSGSALISSGNWNQANNLLNLALGNFSTDHYTKLLVSGSGSWANGYNYNFYLNTWYHVVLTSGNDKIRAYINGTLIGDTYSAFMPQSLEQNWICIGNGTYTSVFNFYGLMNDVRIYDHALSAKEVEEISKGLVLHYKLEGSCGGSDNLICNSKMLSPNSSKTNKNCSIRGASIRQLRTDGFYESKGTVSWQGLSTWANSQNFIVGQKYTYSCYFYTDGSTKSLSFYPMMYNSTGTRDTSSTLPISLDGGNFTNGNSKSFGSFSNIIPQKHYATFEWNDTMASIISNGGSIELSMQVHGTFNTDEYACVFMPKLEIGDKATSWTPNPADLEIDQNIEYDCSGYGNNGTRSTGLSTISSSPRYNGSTHFDGIDAHIKVPYNAVCPENIFTLNLWWKKDNLGTKSYETLFGGPSGFEMDTRASTGTSLCLYMASRRGGTLYTGFQFGEWYMITLSRDGINEKYYVNGNLVKTTQAYGMPTGTYRIGAWSSDTSQNYCGEISDFRIYATILTEAQIKQLYNTSATIDKNGNFYSREVIE